MHICVFHHSLDFLFGQSGGRFNTNLLFFSRTKVLGRNVDNPIGIYIEGHLNLRDSPWCRGNSY